MSYGDESEGGRRIDERIGERGRTSRRQSENEGGQFGGVALHEPVQPTVPNTRAHRSSSIPPGTISSTVSDVHRSPSTVSDAHRSTVSDVNAINASLPVTPAEYNALDQLPDAQLTQRGLLRAQNTFAGIVGGVITRRLRLLEEAYAQRESH